MPYIKVGANTITDPVQKAEAFEDSLHAQFTTNPPLFPEQDRNVGQAIRLLYDQPERGLPPLISAQQVRAIATLDHKKAPGLDGITNIALKKLPEKQIQELAEIIQATFALSHYPTCWKSANVILIRNFDFQIEYGSPLKLASQVKILPL